MIAVGGRRGRRRRPGLGGRGPEAVHRVRSAPRTHWARVLLKTSKGSDASREKDKTTQFLMAYSRMSSIQPRVAGVGSSAPRRPRATAEQSGPAPCRRRRRRWSSTCALAQCESQLVDPLQVFARRRLFDAKVGKERASSRRIRAVTVSPMLSASASRLLLSV